MSIFNLWNPVIQDEAPNVLSFVITGGDAYGINKGTQHFFEEAAASLGVDIEIISWNVRPSRSKYYTDFLGEPEWRDNWQLVWKARIEGVGPLKPLRAGKSPWTGVDIFDDSWSGPCEDGVNDEGCLIVADFTSAANRQRAKAVMQSDQAAKSMQTTLGLPDPVFDVSTVANKYHQLQAELGRLPASFYAEGAGYGEYMMSICKEHKGTVHFADRKFL